ncbi:MAG: hypothetical protein F6J97_09200 [Leptolyngbya sp. SIO4C1]|nr:hypothetical protein [Leptolyngbya sp. SIO4C1]
MFRLTDDEFYQCRHNPDVKFVRNAKGKILMMAPTGGETGRQNANLTADFVVRSVEGQDKPAQLAAADIFFRASALP